MHELVPKLQEVSLILVGPDFSKNNNMDLAETMKALSHGFGVKIGWGSDLDSGKTVTKEGSEETTAIVPINTEEHEETDPSDFRAPGFFI